jgi:hypothetical protein
MDFAQFKVEFDPRFLIGGIFDPLADHADHAEDNGQSHGHPDKAIF